LGSSPFAFPVYSCARCPINAPEFTGSFDSSGRNEAVKYRTDYILPEKLLFVNEQILAHFPARVMQSRWQLKTRQLEPGFLIDYLRRS
jgi:hypothetical protein